MHKSILVALPFVAVVFATFSASAVDVDFLREMVAIPSVSDDMPQVNRATRAMAGYLEKRGVFCTVEKMGNGREVLYASVTPGKGHDFVLAPHLDVVPPTSPDQFTMRREGDRVIGRGAYDCKGRAVAVAEVLCALVGKNVSVGCIFGSDEEIGGESTKWMVNEKGYAPKKMAIIPDASYGKLVYAHKGHTLFRIKVRGRGGHSSRPWECDDSIAKMSRDYLKIREIWDKRHPLAEDKWSDVLTATQLKADDGALNLIPQAVDLVLNLRSVSPAAKDEAMELIKSVTGCEVEIILHSSPVTSNPGHPLMERLRKVMSEIQDFEVPFDRMFAATDARAFVTCGVPIAMLGTKGHGAHAADEWDTLSSQDEMRDFLVKFLLQEAVSK
jgi:acetylornithine deacetylase/succinyl-diaminopimelate desuccinylase-like protein